MKSDRQHLAALGLLRRDTSAQVNVNQFDEAVLEPGAQRWEHPLDQQVTLLAEVAEGAGEEQADGAGCHRA